MKRTNTIFLAAVLSISQLGYAAETGPVAEVFACNYRDGGSMSDIDAATENYKAQLGAIGSDAVSAIDAYVWTPLRASTEFDVLWFGIHANLNAFGAASDALAGAAGQAVQARYFEAVDCGSSIHNMTQIYTSEQVEFTGPTVIDAFRCNLHEGKTMADVESTLEEWRAHITAQGMHDNYIAFMMTPIASSSGYDVSFFGVHADAAAYAARTTADLTTDAGRMMSEKFNALQRCESSVWNGRQMLSGSN